jgi:hypothetical protein
MGGAQDDDASELPPTLDVLSKQSISDRSNGTGIDVPSVRADESPQQCRIGQVGGPAQLALDDSPQLSTISRVEKSRHGWGADYF